MTIIIKITTFTGKSNKVLTTEFVQLCNTLL